MNTICDWDNVACLASLMPDLVNDAIFCIGVATIVAVCVAVLAYLYGEQMPDDYFDPEDEQ